MPNAEQPSGYRELFRLAGFTPLILSSLFARMATQMFSVLIVLFVLGTGHSSALSGIVLLVGQVPGILVSPIAGALLERNAKVMFMKLDFFTAAVAMALISSLSIVHLLSTGALLCIVAVSSFTQPLSRVGGRSLFPMLVPRELWDRSNALDSGTFVISSVLGPGIAGISVSVIGARWSLMVPAALSLLAAGVLSWVVVPNRDVHHEVGVFADAIAGIRYVSHNRVLRMLAGTMTIYNMGSGALAVAIPVLVLHRLHGGSESVGLFFGAMGLAGFVAGMVMGRIGTERREKGVLSLGCALSALGFTLLAFTHDPELAGLEIALCGIANGPLVVAMFSLRQRATDPLWFGRAFAVSMNVNFAGYPIGAAIAGALLTHSIALAFVVAAGLSLLGGVWPTILPSRFYEPPTTEISRPIVAME
ncbi:MAG TPA: MFS transporter [Acidimicrobiales bacterium]|nr:MFS transporter [Acidimicrobiales bacterium]